MTQIPIIQREIRRILTSYNVNTIVKRNIYNWVFPIGIIIAELKKLGTIKTCFKDLLLMCGNFYFNCALMISIKTQMG
jgi:hypothetical protein